MPRSTVNGGTRCSASGSLVQALKRVISIISREFSLSYEWPVLQQGDCSSIRTVWKGACGEALRRLPPGRAQSKLRAIVKSSDRLWDRSCPDCDKKLAQEARSAWVKKMGIDKPMPKCSWAKDPLWILQERVRELVSGWGKGLEESRDVGKVGSVYVPDQQGCLEVPRREGGTLACAPSECEPCDSIVRIGVAKTKGKFRVVTMQGARVKRVLTPVHNALYDHISSHDWCVRGDLTAEHLAAVVDDRRDGEAFISGDYESATDNICHKAVHAIVDVLCEDEDLSPMEREVLRNSFRNLMWRSKSGVCYPIRRGSMMGNLVSFPILCLLNKACFDIVCDISYGWGQHRRGRFNGDDCCFAGSERFFSLWREVTSTFGLVVNTEKTGFSKEWIELNSRCYEVRFRKLVAKPVVSFLRRSRDDDGNLLLSVIDGTRGLLNSTRLWIINSLMRFEIIAHGFGHEGLSPAWFNHLIKKKWFRGHLGEEPAIVETGVNRAREMVVDQPPPAHFYKWVNECAKEKEREFVLSWTGRKVEPRTRTLKMSEARSKIQSRGRTAFRYKLGRKEWAFVWPRDVLEEFEVRFGREFLVPRCLTEWYDDHVFLQVRTPLKIVGTRPGFRFQSRTYDETFWKNYPLGWR